ncbi:unnamed protein product [Staurois parvus]|uniref:Uncharacterized protein n=1 Tax=Staurois parvus TaxID=386267 RepID=A0ABN9ERP3_9NEOB|nr:unnamed protein product [Staurois parvus]
MVDGSPSMTMTQNIPSRQQRSGSRRSTLSTCHPEDLPPLMTRLLFAIRLCTISADNCAVMQCFTQTKFTSFFSHK